MDYDVIKLTFVPGLNQIVLNELASYPDLQVVEQNLEAIYLRPIYDLQSLMNLRSVTNVYITRREAELNPHFISKHKAILGGIIDTVLRVNTTSFKSYKLSCAGTQSKEVKAIQRFIAETFKVTVAEDADLEVSIGKVADIWEVGVRLTPRPLSLRMYKVANIKGGLNPTIAYAMNTFCKLDTKTSYLNIFSGSATLLIEAAISNPDLKLFGFDIDGKSNALAVTNIKKAGFIKKIHLKTADIFKKPDLGKFDVVTSDLPFGMQVSKGEDLGKLYQSFIHYCEETLEPNGVLIMYTSEYTVLEEILNKSKFNITQTIDLKLPTSIGAYLYPKIFICTFQ